MISKKLRYCLLGMWLFSSVGILAWGVWPQAHESLNLVIPGIGLMTMGWNPKNRLGDITVIELKFETSDEQSQSDAPQPIRASNYSNYSRRLEVSSENNASRVLEARLEIPGVDLNPRDTMGQSFRPGDEVGFYWKVISRTEGDFQGRIWLYVGNQSLVGDLGDRYPITVQTVELQWRDLFGLSGIKARYIGLFGLIAGILLASLLWFRARQVQILDLD